MYYNELGTRVKLAKRRYKGKKRNKIKLVVKPRELLDHEMQQLVSTPHSDAATREYASTSREFKSGGKFKNRSI